MTETVTEQLVHALFTQEQRHLGLSYLAPDEGGVTSPYGGRYSMLPGLRGVDGAQQGDILAPVFRGFAVRPLSSGHPGVDRAQRDVR